MAFLDIGRNRNFLASAAVAVCATFGVVEESSALSCSLDLMADGGELEVGGMGATACGWSIADPTDSIANTPTEDPQLPTDYLGWDVNLDNGDGIPLKGFWQYYYKQDLNNEIVALRGHSPERYPLFLRH